MDKKNSPSHKTEIWIGHILRAGVITSALLVLAGGISFLLHQGGALPEYQTFSGEPARLKGLGPVLKAGLGLHPQGTIELGILLLIATPIARVLFSILVFARQKDWLYVWVTFFVFCILALSLLFGK